MPHTKQYLDPKALNKAIRLSSKWCWLVIVLFVLSVFLIGGCEDRGEANPSRKQDYSAIATQLAKKHDAFTDWHQTASAKQLRAYSFELEELFERKDVPYSAILRVDDIKSDGDMLLLHAHPGVHSSAPFVIRHRVRFRIKASRDQIAPILESSSKYWHEVAIVFTVQKVYAADMQVRLEVDAHEYSDSVSPYLEEVGQSYVFVHGNCLELVALD